MVLQERLDLSRARQPTVAGLGGVQQFFEALGLAKPPKVELKTPSIQLKGGPGQTLTASIEVATSEKKHVFAFAVSDQPWVKPGTQPKQGKSAMVAAIPLTVNVPPSPGEVVRDKITVTGNGNQKFTVPLTLAISGSPGDPVPVQAIPLSAGAVVRRRLPRDGDPDTDHGRGCRGRRRRRASRWFPVRFFARRWARGLDTDGRRPWSAGFQINTGCCGRRRGLHH